MLKFASFIDEKAGSKKESNSEHQPYLLPTFFSVSFGHDSVFVSIFAVESKIRAEFFDRDYFEITSAIQGGNYNETTIRRILTKTQ